MTLAQLQQVQREKDTRKQIKELHAEYCRLTKLNLALKRNEWDASRVRPWFDFIKAGHTKEELALVIAFRKKRIKEGRRYPESLSFRNLICNLDYFGEDVAEARAVNRSPRIDHERKFVLEATGRPVVAEKDAVQASNVDWKAAWEKMKEELRK
jgi:hypothetical protein